MSGRDVARLRESLGLKQAEFAALLHISQSAISQWETGVTRVSSPMAELVRMKVAEVRAAAGSTAVA